MRPTTGAEAKHALGRRAGDRGKAAVAPDVQHTVAKGVARMLLRGFGEPPGSAPRGPDLMTC